LVGAVAFGAALFLWVVLLIAGRSSSGPDSSSLSSSSAPIADYGLYLFLFGAGMLMYCGYQLLLAAARGPVQVAPETIAPVVAAVLASMSAGLPGGAPPASLQAMPPIGQAAPTTVPLAPQAPETATPAAPHDNSGANRAASSTPGNGVVALPGSAAWSVT